MSSARRIVVHEALPERATPAERIAMLDADIREATAKARRRLEDHAQQYVVRGYKIDDDNWEMGVAGRNVSVIMRLVRPD